MTRLRFGRFVVDVTHEDKVLFPDCGVTKGELVNYYRLVARMMLPHTRDRPLVMQRFPDVITQRSFYHEQAPDALPSWIRTVTVRNDGRNVRHVLANDGATLVYLANLGSITPHTWLSRRDALQCPDQLIFDLDPGPLHEFGAIRAAALHVRELCLELSLASFVRTTGARGLHVLVPLDRSETFAQVRRFAQDMAVVVSSRYPHELTTESHGGERGRHVCLDTARNRYGRTAVPAYAVRARPGAPVATPLGWSELDDPGLVPGRHHIRNTLDRLKAKADPWLQLRRRAASLKVARARLDAIIRDELRAPAAR